MQHQYRRRELAVVSHSNEVDMIGLVNGFRSFFDNAPPLTIFSGNFIEKLVTAERYRKILSVTSDVLYVDRLSEAQTPDGQLLIDEINQVLGRYTSGVLRALIISHPKNTRLLINGISGLSILQTNILPGSAYGFKTSGEHVAIDNPA